MDNSQMGGAGHRCGHGKMMPWLVILVGLAFLLEALNVLTASFVGIVWPILVIIAGVMKLGGCKCNQK